MPYLLIVVVVVGVVLYVLRQLEKEAIAAIVVHRLTNSRPGSLRTSITVRELCQEVNLEMKRKEMRGAFHPDHARKFLLRFVYAGEMQIKTRETFVCLPKRHT